MASETKVTEAKIKLIKQILAFNDGSAFDFDLDYLKEHSIERLKHILLYCKTMRIGLKVAHKEK